MKVSTIKNIKVSDEEMRKYLIKAVTRDKLMFELRKEFDKIERVGKIVSDIVMSGDSFVQFKGCLGDECKYVVALEYIHRGCLAVFWNARVWLDIKAGDEIYFYHQSSKGIKKKFPKIVKSIKLLEGIEVRI